MSVSIPTIAALGAAGLVTGFAAHQLVGANTTAAQRESIAKPLNFGGAIAGIAGLAIAGLGPTALRPLGIGVGIAGAAAFIGSQLLLPHGFSPSAE